MSLWVQARFLLDAKFYVFPQSCWGIFVCWAWKFEGFVVEVRKFQYFHWVLWIVTENFLSTFWNRFTFRSCFSFHINHEFHVSFLTNLSVLTEWYFYIIIKFMQIRWKSESEIRDFLDCAKLIIFLLKKLIWPFLFNLMKLRSKMSLLKFASTNQIWTLINPTV